MVTSPRPVRIAYIAPVGFVGGAEVSLLELLRGIDRGRFAPTLFCLDHGPLVSRVQALGIPAQVIAMPRRIACLSLRGRRSAPWSVLAAGPGSLACVLRLARALRLARPDLVHTNGTKAHMLGGLAARLAGRPVIWHARDFLGEGSVERLLSWVGSWLPRRIVANSEAVAASWRRRGGPAGRVTAIHNGVDLAGFRPEESGAAFRDLLGIPRDVPLVGMVGLLAPWKGQMEFLEAARLVAERVPRARFVIVGDEMYQTNGHGTFADAVRTRARSLGLADRLTFAGYHEDIPGVMAALDLVVHASTAPEPFGRVLVEAMAAGRAVVATDAGAAREVLGEEEAGILVPPGAVHPLADAIAGLLADPARRERLARAGRARVEQRFSLEAHVQRISTVYAEILEESREPRALRGGAPPRAEPESREPRGEA
jgi:glycosyltransferase involved in cell wall biosynthesis